MRGEPIDSTAIAYDAAGLVPAVVQDARTAAVLMVAWMNEEALRRTVTTGRVHFWSRSRQELWEKGATSGNTLRLVSITPDCDADTLLVIAEPAGPTCHTGATSCFGEVAGVGFADLEPLWVTIAARAATRPDRSYTTHLLAGGPDRTGRKVLEEAAEVVEAALAHAEGRADDQRLAEEAADLVYHLLVALAERDVSPALVVDLLRDRRPAG